MAPTSTSCTTDFTTLTTRCVRSHRTTVGEAQMVPNGFWISRVRGNYPSSNKVSHGFSTCPSNKPKATWLDPFRWPSSVGCSSHSWPLFARRLDERTDQSDSRKTYLALWNSYHREEANTVAEAIHTEIILKYGPPVFLLCAKAL